MILVKQLLKSLAHQFLHDLTIQERKKELGLDESYYA
jgi:hypothetical protein